VKSYIGAIGEYITEYTIERSRFITTVKQIDGEDDAKAFIAEIKKKNSLATHNCYAYVADDIGLIRKFSDDGEPQGTAGMPMLEVLKAGNLRKTAVVVTRYFGGIKLGAGGLVRAYAKAAADGVNGAKKAEFIYSTVFKLSLDYEKYALFAKYRSKCKTAVVNTEFFDGVTATVAVAEDNADLYLKELNDCFNGRIAVEEVNKVFYPFEV